MEFFSIWPLRGPNRFTCYLAQSPWHGEREGGSACVRDTICMRISRGRLFKIEAVARKGTM